MSFVNDVRLIGYCAETPRVKTTKTGKYMAVLVMYTKEYIGNENYYTQAHRCICFGKCAENIVKQAVKGKFICIKGALRTNRIDKGSRPQYYTNILIENFQVAPTQSLLALKDTIREILEAENITSCDELTFFQEDGSSL